MQRNCRIHGVYSRRECSGMAASRNSQGPRSAPLVDLGGHDIGKFSAFPAFPLPNIRSSSTRNDKRCELLPAHVIDHKLETQIVEFRSQQSGARLISHPRLTASISLPKVTRGFYCCLCRSLRPLLPVPVWPLPYCRYQGFCTQYAPAPRAVIMHCSNEVKAQLVEPFLEPWYWTHHGR